MSKKELVPNRQYTEEFKVEAIRLADAIGGNAAAKRLGVPQSTVTNWVRTRKTGRQGSAPSGPESTVMARRPVSELEAENARLRKELVNAKLDLEIVKKAAAYFVRESRRDTPGSKGIATRSASPACVGFWRSRARATASGEAESRAIERVRTRSLMRPCRSCTR